MNIRSRLQKQTDHLCIASQGGIVQRGLLHVVCRIGLTAVSQELPSQLDRIHCNRFMKTGLSKATFGQVGMDTKAWQRNQFMQCCVLQTARGSATKRYQMKGCPTLETELQLSFPAGARFIVDKAETSFAIFSDARAAACLTSTW